MLAVPSTMIRAKVLPTVLNQILSDGITAAFLMTSDGALLGTVGSMNIEVSSLPVVDNKVVGAIVANVWGEYAESAKEIFADETLQVLFLHFDQNKSLAIASAGTGYLVCAYSDGTAPMGLVKARLQALQPFLKGALQQIQLN
ncbi:hypothetical protein H257_07069 [Aphanomyces astaci]|uniref:Roadblock/LAMTOR2 domain-containing protein n=2 Tax=Aphanomyces astaci TaxID=112090 RepID=W4GJH0_APHAT|nr:hypothetical protein H257_07069 [Aphanomyces astaci]ETV79855.1 hypothetical protein H257_07069 [Aphanomyces astaci]RHY03899.1 hypothetical protein DYB36_009803 [Aphanomyces astaci]RHY50007.1 hypothetical protein DYB30_011632 [Aphanomyces astaci]RHZ26451.1 hypothetical protein DYB31_002166 [Aphanomyces astaci]RQM30777.1 hypothetical protein B5M09_004885 [Aphanomyces astaci]|eukprot:XP_009830791.1 hypothetical protein H257_07069 [Aphanomyces astaci]